MLLRVGSTLEGTCWVGVRVKLRRPDHSGSHLDAYFTPFLSPLSLSLSFLPPSIPFFFFCKTCKDLTFRPLFNFFSPCRTKSCTRFSHTLYWMEANTYKLTSSMICPLHCWHLMFFLLSQCLWKLQESSALGSVVALCPSGTGSDQTESFIRKLCVPSGKESVSDLLRNLESGLER